MILPEIAPIIYIGIVTFVIGMFVEHVLNERKLAKICCLECWTKWNEES